MYLRPGPEGTKLNFDPFIGMQEKHWYEYAVIGAARRLTQVVRTDMHAQINAMCPPSSRNCVLSCETMNHIKL